MTGTDLIVLAPWIVFAVALAVICLVLHRSRRALGPGPWRPPRPVPGDQGPDPQESTDPQETRCSEKNAEARPQ